MQNLAVPPHSETSSFICSSQKGPYFILHHFNAKALEAYASSASATAPSCSIGAAWVCGWLTTSTRVGSKQPGEFGSVLLFLLKADPASRVH
jgi:hypothetical protein